MGLTLYFAYILVLHKDQQEISHHTDTGNVTTLPVLVSFWSPHWYRTYTPFGLLARLFGKADSVVLTRNSATATFVVSPEHIEIKIAKNNIITKETMQSCTITPHWFYGATRTSLVVTDSNKALYTVVFSEAVTKESLKELLTSYNYPCTTT